MPHEKLWVLALNSEHARILRGLTRRGQTEDPEFLLEAKHHDLRELMSDKPGRAFALKGGRRSALEYSSDPVRDEERAFAEEVVEALQEHLEAGDFDRLAIFASPEMLGILRPKLPEAIKSVVITEVPKNLLHLPPPDLAHVVAEHLYAK